MAAGALFAMFSGVMLGRSTTAGAPGVVRAERDPCGLPAGITMDGLAPADRAYVVERAMACRDLVHGRIDRDAYGAAMERPAAALVPAMLWGASVRGFSTQYTDGSWSASRALGPPDVFPAGGDQVNAWASAGADDRVEYLELGLERPASLSAVEIFETFNPGAVTQVELIAESGRRIVVGQRAPAATGSPAHKHRIDFTCTAERIVAVRLTIDSPSVPGWNEIDAVGAQPCTAR